MGKNSKDIVERRRKELLSYISQQPNVTVDDLVRELRFSPATIRRDINQLLHDRLIVRTYKGQISLLNETTFDDSYFRRFSACLAEKAAIAKTAIELVNDGDSIGIDCSTTCLEFSKLLLQRKNISVVTNNLFVPQFLSQHSSLQLFCVGGFVSLQKYSTEGQTACAEISQHNFDIAFFSITGLDFQAGLTSNLRETDTQLAFIRQAKKSVLLLDSSKIGVRAAHNFLQLREIDLLIVDDGIRPEHVAQLDQLGVPYRIAHR